MPMIHTRAATDRRAEEAVQGRVPTFLLFLLLAATLGCQDDRPAIAAAAREYREAWIAQDGVRFHAILVREDADQLTPETSVDTIQELWRSGGFQEFDVLDSVDVVEVRGDAAIVRSLVTGPDFSDERVVRHASLKNAGIISVDSAIAAFAKLPTRQIVDSTVLLREEESWKVWVGVDLAREFERIYERYIFEEVYPIDEMADALTVWLDRVGSMWPGVPKWHRRLAADARARAEVADSLRVNVTLEHSRPGTIVWVRGTVHNPTSRTVTQFAFIVWDSAGSPVLWSVTDEPVDFDGYADVGSGETIEYSNSFVSTRPPANGPASRVRVIDVMLPGSIPRPDFGGPVH